MLALAPDTEELVRAKAIAAGKTPDQIIREALGGAPPRNEHARRASGKKASLDHILAIADRSASRPLFDRRTADAIIGYDERGLPA